MKSITLSRGMHAEWVKTASPEDIAKVDDIFALAERNYEAGGDMIVECFSPAEMLKEFKTLADIQEAVRRYNERAMEMRWGDDTDPEVNKPEWKDER